MSDSDKFCYEKSIMISHSPSKTKNITSKAAFDKAKLSKIQYCFLLSGREMIEPALKNPPNSKSSPISCKSLVPVTFYEAKNSAYSRAIGNSV